MSANGKLDFDRPEKRITCTGRCQSLLPSDSFPPKSHICKACAQFARRQRRYDLRGKKVHGKKVAFLE